MTGTREINWHLYYFTAAFAFLAGSSNPIARPNAADLRTLPFSLSIFCSFMAVFSGHYFAYVTYVHSLFFNVAQFASCKALWESSWEASRRNFNVI